MKTKAFLILFALNLFFLAAISQTTLTLQPTKDAMVREFGGVGDETNYGDYQYINMHAWTNGNTEVNHRSLIDFDFSLIPEDATILSAQILLYVDRNSLQYPNGHEPLTGSNQCLIQRLTSDWEEHEVNWNNQPERSNLDQSIIPQSTNPFQDYAVDVTALVQDILNDPSGSFGLGIKIQDETPYRRMVFASRDNPNPSIHPRLLISYISTSNLITLQPTKDAMVREFGGVGDETNYGDYQYINMHAWTNGNTEVNHRSLIDFDFSLIPEDATILSAQILLFVDRNSVQYPNGHEPLTGSNQCLIQRLTSDWEEYEVNWNNQPERSNLNQSIIPQSTSPFQDYTVDVTALVQDILNDPSGSFGFGIKIQDEIPYRRMVFASRDNPNPSIHPRLLISFFNPEILDVKKKVDSQNLNFSIFPNPANSEVYLSFNYNQNKEYSVELCDLTGNLIYKNLFINNGMVNIDICHLQKGVYVVRIFEDSNCASKKLVVQ